MKLQLIETADGSHSIYVQEQNEHFHSVHGAINEANCVYIEAGFKFAQRQKPPLSIFEMGLGTHLNALLTWIEAERSKTKVEYLGIEAFPLEKSILDALNYGQFVNAKFAEYLHKLHACPWEEKQDLSPYFSFEKRNISLEDFESEQKFNVIYFDAFAPDIQPELWSVEVFAKMYRIMKPQGVLSTYCAKGQVKRNLKAAGFAVEGLPGPIGKREITRAVRQGIDSNSIIRSK